MLFSAKHLLRTDNSNNSVGYGKIVDTLSIDDVIEFNKSGIRIVLVRNPISDEVKEAVKNTSLTVYDDINEETIQRVLSMLNNMKGATPNET
jgi:predicted ATP-grasp superfamily ATP-dependent carboligase